MVVFFLCFWQLLVCILDSSIYPSRKRSQGQLAFLEMFQRKELRMLVNEEISDLLLFSKERPPINWKQEIYISNSNQLSYWMSSQVVSLVCSMPLYLVDTIIFVSWSLRSNKRPVASGFNWQPWSGIRGPRSSERKSSCDNHVNRAAQTSSIASSKLPRWRFSTMFEPGSESRLLQDNDTLHQMLPLHWSDLLDSNQFICCWQSSLAICARYYIPLTPL